MRHRIQLAILGLILITAFFISEPQPIEAASACYTESGFIGPMPVPDTIIEHVIFTDDEAQEILSTIVEENWYRKYDSLGVFTFDSDTIWYCVWNPRTMTVDTRQCYCNEVEFKVAKGLMKKPATKHLPSQTSKPVSAHTFGGKLKYYSTEEEKIRAQRAYITRFKEVAKAEQRKYKVPACITLAQGILESGAATSTLAVKANNHFGIKCFSKSCKKGHCMNKTDDHHKDYFRIYNSAWESFRAHSKLLQASRYKRLYKLDPNDYKSWANGLKEAGYATDKKYAEKLIEIIERHDLIKYNE